MLIAIGGCESHRIFEGLKERNHEKLCSHTGSISKVNLLMGELKTIKNAALLRSGCTGEEGDLK